MFATDNKMTAVIQVMLGGQSRRRPADVVCSTKWLFFFPPMDHVVPNFVGSLSNVRGPWPKLETFLLFQWPGILSSKDDVQRAPLSLSRALLEGIYKNKKRRKPYLASQHNCCWWGVSSDSSSMATGINSMQFKTHHSRTHTHPHTHPITHT